MRILRYLCVLALCFFSAALLAAEPPSQWIAVTAPAFRSAIEPLCEFHKSQGMGVVVLQSSDVLSEKEILTGDATKLRDRVNTLCREFKGKSYILLIGAVEAAGLTDPVKQSVPALRGTIGRMKGQPTDHGYGCPDPDMLSTVAVGRFPARTAEEARQMVQKTLAQEQDTAPGEWRRRLTVLAGVPAFNPVVDALVEGVALGRLDKLDPSWSGHAIFHNATSRFCVPDRLLHDRALEYVQAGQALTLYLGHSGPAAFWAGRARYLDRKDWATLKIPCGRGVFATFGCLGCQLCGADGEGYGVAAVRNPEGPVAVLGSHGICFAAMVHLAADGLFESFLGTAPAKDLGECWLAIQKSVAKGPINPLTFRMLDAVDGDSNIPEKTQRQEHLEMFVLLGDPALRMPAISQDIKLTAGPISDPNIMFQVRGVLPDRLKNARVRLTLERPLTSEPTDLQRLPMEPGAERDRVMLANHDRANRFVLQKWESTSTEGGSFSVVFALPKDQPWPRLILRAYAADDRQEAIGVLSLPVKK